MILNNDMQTLGILMSTHNIQLSNNTWICLIYCLICFSCPHVHYINCTIILIACSIIFILQYLSCFSSYNVFPGEGGFFAAIFSFYDHISSKGTLTKCLYITTFSDILYSTYFLYMFLLQLGDIETSPRPSKEIN